MKRCKCGSPSRHQNVMVKKYTTVTGERREYKYTDDRCKKCQSVDRAKERQRRREIPRCECGGVLYNLEVEHDGKSGPKTYRYLSCRKCKKTHDKHGTTPAH